MKSWWGVVARFLIHGLIVSTWVSRIPAVKGAIGLGDGALGMALVGSAVGSMGGIPLSGWLVSRFGSRRTCTWSSVGFALALVLPAMAATVTQLFLALLVFGVTGAANDVAMNSQAVAVEKALGTPSMSRFHAMFSLGGIAGAGLGAVIAGRHISAVAHLTGAALFVLVCAFATAPLLTNVGYPQRRTSGTARFILRHLSRPLVLLSAIGFCIFLAEGAVADWTAVYLKQVLQANPGTASAGYAVFSASMFTFRLAGDRITATLGRARTLRTGAFLAAAGLSVMLLVPKPGWAMPGLALAGAGFSSIIPVVFAASGRVNRSSEGAGVATVSGLGYIGFLLGPPAIGFVSQMTSLRVGLCIVVALTMVAGLLVGALEKYDLVEG